MKNLRKFFGLLLVLCMAFSMTVSVMAEENPEDAYTYTVRIFAGGQGTIGGQDVVVYTGCKYGDRVEFDVSSVVLNNNSKYYVKGIRESGKDNNTVAAPSILVTGDIDYVVAYGLAGSSVAYTVNYQNEAGEALQPSVTFYGNVGDKPVISYQYIDGYQPQAYNLTRTLSANAADNVFTFVYTPIALPNAAEEGEGTEAGAEGEENEENITAGGTEAGAEGEVITDENVPAAEPQELVDLDDEDTPLANYNGAGARGKDGAVSALPIGARVGIGAACAALLGFFVWFMLFYKKKKKES